LESVLVMADRLVSRDEATASPRAIQLPTVTSESPKESFRAPALDGCKLLSWMAAVGALRILSEHRRTWLDDDFIVDLLSQGSGRIFIPFFGRITAYH
jgi:hypothetical protein